jgi:hypothetical protein
MIALMHLIPRNKPEATTRLTLTGIVFAGYIFARGKYFGELRWFDYAVIGMLVLLFVLFTKHPGRTGNDHNKV